MQCIYVCWEQTTYFCKLAPYNMMYGYLDFCESQIVKGKYRPTQLVPKQHMELRITIILMIWMHEPLFSTVKDVVVNSGFVLKIGPLHLW